MTKPKQITRAEMQKLLDERCPTASPLVRMAALTGSPITLADGESYQAPDTFDEEYRDRLSPFRIPATIRKIGASWIN